MAKAVLASGERVEAEFRANRGTYIREHVILAALGSVLAVAVLMWMGDPNPWVGVVGAVLAIGVRGWYVASEALGQVWTLTDRRLITPAGVEVNRRDIKAVRVIFSAAQVVTEKGDKHMIKYLPDPAGIAATIRGT
ncbi:MAG: hypothetical protein CR993_05450 [Rhodobacterales bacterium]|nr:MAG: hypothetical protein CR993_05450 [Rhodobacterales bacterium]